MAPKAITSKELGPALGMYSHGMTVPAGEIVIVAGQVGTDRAGEVAGSGDVVAQTTQAFKNVRAVLTAAGCAMTDVVRFPTFLTEDGEITYAQLQEMVNRAGNALRELGVEAEQRVLCLLLDSPAFLATFWGAIKIGAIPIPINTMMRSQDYLYFLNDSRAKVAVIS